MYPRCWPLWIPINQVQGHACQSSLGISGCGAHLALPGESDVAARSSSASTGQGGFQLQLDAAAGCRNGEHRGTLVPVGHNKPRRRAATHLHRSTC